MFLAIKVGIEIDSCRPDSIISECVLIVDGDLHFLGVGAENEHFTPSGFFASLFVSSCLLLLLTNFDNHIGILG